MKGQLPRGLHTSFLLFIVHHCAGAHPQPLLDRSSRLELGDGTIAPFILDGSFPMSVWDKEDIPMTVLTSTKHVLVTCLLPFTQEYQETHSRGGVPPGQSLPLPAWGKLPQSC